MVRRVAAQLVAYIRSAPGTFIWLAVLFVTSVIAHVVNAHELTDMLRARSTNLHHLLNNPAPSLVRSALWIDGNGWVGYAVVYLLIHATVERWLGTARWLLIAVVAHIGATFISQGVLLWAIDTHRAPHSYINVIDIGVSYALAGVAGVLAYAFRWRWRVPYLAALLMLVGSPVIAGFVDDGHPTFTDIGHLCAVLIGLLAYPLTLPRQHLRVNCRLGVGSGAPLH